ncbi:DUF4307 domain-containing protein [Actinomadura luteofluorescens]|uniref:DUF4307 domain-containing protein n=1 Tax=Actinomadura luteofluorescens TaxID=46163 RepID=UPI003627F58D
MVPDNTRTPHEDSRHDDERVESSGSGRVPAEPSRPGGRRPPRGGDGGGFGILAAHTGQTPGIVPQTVTYDITDTSVEINYTVAKGKGDDVRCTVDAYDTDFAVLAQKEVSAPPGTSSVKGAETLQTPRRATGARIRDCRKV